MQADFFHFRDQSPGQSRAGFTLYFQLEDQSQWLPWEHSIHWALVALQWMLLLLLLLPLSSSRHIFLSTVFSPQTEAVILLSVRLSS